MLLGCLAELWVPLGWGRLGREGFGIGAGPALLLFLLSAGQLFGAGVGDACALDTG